MKGILDLFQVMSRTSDEVVQLNPFILQQKYSYFQFELQQL